MPIELYIGPILEASLKIDERVLIGHVSYLKHKGSEVINVIAKWFQSSCLKSAHVAMV